MGVGDGPLRPKWSEAAKKKSVKLLLLQIPREVMEQQAAAKGDVRFLILAYLEAKIQQPDKAAPFKYFA